MTLGDIVRMYREQHNMSQRQFAIKCGLSNGYIGMLERGKNPRSGQPIVPSLPAIKKIADAMSVTVNEILMKIDVTTVDISGDLADPFPDGAKEAPAQQDERTQEFVSLFSRLLPEHQTSVIHMMRGLLLDQTSGRDSQE